MPRRALVIGGSMGGLLAAHLLRHAGWDVVVCERSEVELTGRGAGIGTHAQLLDIMRRIGIPFDDSMGVRVGRLICLDRAGRVVAERPTVRTMSSWARLFRALKGALPARSYRHGLALERVVSRDDGVVAEFAGGARLTGDILVGADGIRSTVRAQYLPDIEPDYAGYVAWRAMIDEADIPPDIHAEVFERYTFCLPEGEQLLAYPVPGRDCDTGVGRRAYNIVWYRPVEPENMLADLCTDAQGHHHGPAIPPPLIRSDVIAGIKRTARDLLAPQIAEIFARTPRPFFQPIFDLDSPRIVFGRVAMLGDAAFVARPHVGAGVTKAALDAVSLADALSAHGDDIETGLAQYEAVQRPFGSGLVALSRAQGAYLSAQLKPVSQRTDAERHRDIDSVFDSHRSRSFNVARLVGDRPPA